MNAIPSMFIEVVCKVVAIANSITIPVVDVTDVTKCLAPDVVEGEGSEHNMSHNRQFASISPVLAWAKNAFLCRVPFKHLSLETGDRSTC